MTAARAGLAAMTAALVAGLAAPSMAGEASASAARGHDVTVTVTDLRSTKGRVIACMTPDPQSFPKCRGAARAYRVDAPAGEALRLTFKGVKPGRYAIALLHDENGNGKADRALGMMPKEGFGFSRDAKVRMGPPSFQDAVFPVGAANEKLTIRMRYML